MRRSIVAATVAAVAWLPLAVGQAAAQPLFTPEPDGVIRVDSAPGEWWKCGLYSIDPPTAKGLPPVVNYSPGSWSSPTGQLPTDTPLPDFATPPAYAEFAPGTQVLADCISQYAPIFWLQVIQTQP
ncbi:hypothetical protein ACFXO9_27940 [Nocardia tengchongensis]|uniref:hypothetical protein n=1 Tax=Nocardia tengchongensis TaxID=2055889 RepID=UPI00368116EA